MLPLPAVRPGLSFRGRRRSIERRGWASALAAAGPDGPRPGPVPRWDAPPVPDPPVADGGLGWCDLNAFQRDVLLAIADLNDGHPYGRQIKARLDERYSEPVGQSRLYQALDALAGLGLVDKRHGTIDARTNYYGLTDAASRLIRAHTHHCVRVVGLDDRCCPAANP